MKSRVLAATATAGLLLAGCVADSDDDGTGDTVNAPEAVELGVLTCQLADVDNLLVYAEESFVCTFEGDERMTRYAGNITKIGANLEFKGEQTLRWLVLAPVRYDVPGALEGDYVGASASASIGVGAGAKILIGGSGDQITLQPLSVSTTTEAVGASLTLDSLELTYQGMV